VSKKPKETGFEATLAELESLVCRMEAGDLPLDQALGHFERGVKLTRECQLQLQQAQQRVQILQQQAGGAVLDVFASADDLDTGR
jgi:exodeoxyribonuclease VII small subunit